MCAILGVSFAPGSTVNRYKLASALLREGEIRGSDASGYAAIAPDGTEVLFKKDVKGSNLNVSRIPKDAVAMLLHTRNSTHGTPTDNENNHPIVSSSGDIRLIHNGVISNHEEVREALGKEGKLLPDVDSAVIPAVMEVFGLDGTDLLRGYAACAWFDRESGATIHLAKFRTSSVYYVTLLDGSLVFASTDVILSKALRSVGLQWIGNYPSPFKTLAESEYLQILDGEVIGEGEVEFGRYDTAAYGWQNVTDGKSQSTYQGGSAHPSGATVTPISGKQPTNPNPGNTLATSGAAEKPVTVMGAKPSPPTQTKAVGSEAVKAASEKSAFGTPASHSTKGSEDKRPLALDQGPVSGKPAALFSSSELISEEDYERWAKTGVEPQVKSEEEDDEDEFDSPLSLVYGYDDPDFIDPFEGNTKPRFFTQSHDGDYQDFTNFASLMSSLAWVSEMHDTENLLVGPEEGLLRWVNHIADVGFLSSEDETDGDIEFSWVASKNNMEPFEPMVPTWVKDGLDKLRMVTVGN